MKPSSDYSTIEALASVIAHSQIVVFSPNAPCRVRPPNSMTRILPYSIG